MCRKTPLVDISSKGLSPKAHSQWMLEPIFRESRIFEQPNGARIQTFAAFPDRLTTDGVFCEFTSMNSPTITTPEPEAESPKPEFYWRLAREPLACLIFLLPLLLIYEVGVLWIGAGGNESGVRNGADYWMRGWLQNAGLDSVLILPLMVVGVLLAWHRAGDYEWRISRETLVGMFAESLLLAVCLLVVAQVQDMAFQCWFPSALSVRDHGAGERPLLSLAATMGPRMIAFVGAGVYEEVMFRLAMLPACCAFFQTLRMPKNWAAALAVFLTSLVFSIAHYIGPAGEAFSLFSFTFRVTAGCFFATVFLLRGFGITVGCHALYDILVGILTIAAVE